MDLVRQRVLVTNDDGVEAPGIRWLARCAHEHGWNVVVAAPCRETSGKAKGSSLARRSRHRRCDLNSVAAAEHGREFA